MFVTHAPVHLPSFQQLAHRMMSRLIPSHAMPEIQPIPAEAQQVAGIALEHWDLLFSAVTERLTLSMEALELAMSEVPGAGPATAATRLGVLECVEALNQLRTTMCDVINTPRP